MRGAILPFPQYVFMVWCSVKKKAQGQLYLYLPLRLTVIENVNNFNNEDMLVSELFNDVLSAVLTMYRRIKRTLSRYVDETIRGTREAERSGRKPPKCKSYASPFIVLKRDERALNGTGFIPQA
jgi:hypothetical protein